MSVAEEARAALAEASGELYESIRESGSNVGPWPKDGDYECLFLGFEVSSSDFYYQPPGVKDAKTMEGGASIQMSFQHMPDSPIFEEMVEGDDGTFRGSYSNLPPRMKETLPQLHPGKGRGNQKGVKADIGRIKAAIGYILGRKSTHMLSEVDEINGLIEAGNQIGVVVNVDTRKYTIKNGPRTGETGEDTTDRVTGAFAITAAEVVQPVVNESGA